MQKIVGVLVLLVALALMGLGALGYRENQRNTQAQVLSLDDYIRQRPSARLVRLTSCKLNLLEACYTLKPDGTPENLYVPVHSINDPNPQLIHVLLKVSDETTFTLLKAMQAIKDEADIMNYLSQHRERVFPVRDVEGAVQFKHEFPADKKDVLKKVAAELAPNFVVLAENEQPKAQPDSIYVIIGGVLGVLAMLLLVKRRDSRDI